MFKRGFKSWCEEVAQEYRRQLHIAPGSPIDVFRLAEQMRVRLCTPHDFSKLKPEVKQRLLTVHADCWSAFTISAGPRPVIVYNPTHSVGRTASDLSHELAHIILGHVPSKMFYSSVGIPLRTHNQEQEEEATWLAGCLLLPRPALVRIKSRRVDLTSAASEYGVSTDMLKYRLQITGVNKIFSRARM